VTAGPDHPIRVAHDLLTCEPTPYILIRQGIEARINRGLLRTGRSRRARVGGLSPYARRLEPGPILFAGRVAPRRGMIAPS
jgi:hypothetical protein